MYVHKDKMKHLAMFAFTHQPLYQVQLSPLGCLMKWKVSRHLVVLMQFPLRGVNVKVRNKSSFLCK